MENKAIIEFDNVSQHYLENMAVLRNIDLTIYKGEFVVLIGPSGCGKTTLLKLINGLVHPNDGYVSIKGKYLKDWDIISLRRDIGYVIQQVGLFPHMTVKKNIEYILDLEKKSKAEKTKTSEYLIEMVGLDKSYLNRYPRALSGGQQQRISLARALARDPEIILMDEPFSAVDEITRKSLQNEIKNIYDTSGKTIVFVTHDIEEAFRLGTKIVFLKDGQIKYSGDKKSLLFYKGDPFFDSFFGLKPFSSYLSITPMKAVMKPILNEKRQLVVSIHEEASILEGLKILLENQLTFLYVVDDKGCKKGIFTFDDLNYVLK